MGMEREGEYGKVGGEVFEVGARSGWDDTGILDKGGAAEGEGKEQSVDEGVRV